MPKAETKERDSWKDLMAIPVDEAVEVAFSLPPTETVAIMGKPGIGKTEIVIEKAIEEGARLGKKVVVINRARSEMSEEEYRSLIRDIIQNPDKYYVIAIVSFGTVLPDEIMGVPNITTIRDEEDRVLAVLEQPVLKASLALLTLKGIHGTLILDDIANASDDIRLSFLASITQKFRVVGGMSGPTLSPNVRVIATGNLPEESEIAHRLPKNMVGRIRFLYARETTVEKWAANMNRVYGEAWDKTVYAFLKSYPQYFYYYDESAGFPAYGTPRSWTSLAVALHSLRGMVEKKKREGDRNTALRFIFSIAAGMVGVKAAYDYAVFATKPVDDPDEVLKNPSLLDKILEDGDMDRLLRFVVAVSHNIVAVLERGGQPVKVLGYLKIIDRIRSEIGDIGVFFEELLSPDAKRRIHSLLVKLSKSEDKAIAEEAKALRRKFVSMLVSVELSRVQYS